MKLYGSILLALLTAVCVLNAVEEEVLQPKQGGKEVEEGKEVKLACGKCK
jgi:hypothetical protein